MSAEPADLIITGADVYTVDAVRRWAQAIAVRAGRIAAVGEESRIERFAGPETERLHLPGRLIVPGFQDSHCHPPAAGLERLRCDLNDVVDVAEVEGVIANYAREHPDATWILGGGWSMETFEGGTPSKELLDRLVPDRPVFLTNRDGHGAWVNSRALELAGITEDTADPADGRIQRASGGEPQGTLHEGAMKLVEPLAPRPSREELKEGMLLAQAYLHSLGITAWNDAIVGDPLWGDSHDIYSEMAASGELTAKVVGSLWWRRDAGEEQVEDLLAMRERVSSGRRFSANAVKIMLDGVIENGTAGMLEPYLDLDGRPGTNRGIDFVDHGSLKGCVTRLDAEGFQVHIHAIGDRAVRGALDAFEAALESNGRNDHRHHIAHIQVIHPDDIPRFRRLGVVANAQPLWACVEPQMTELTIPVLGPERSAWQYPFRSLHRSGAVLAFGSDWSVSTANPLLEMEVAVTRIDPLERHNEAFLPDERIDLAEAVAAFTIGTAFVNHLDSETGSIEEGKYADLAVLDRNIFEPDAGPIGDARVLMTLAEGETVFASSEVPA